MSRVQPLVVICTLLCPTAALIATRTSSADLEATPSFASFLAKYGRTFTVGTKEYELRRSLYEDRVAGVRQHNSNPNRLWNAEVNHLIDRTKDELSHLYGLRAVHSGKSGGSATGVVGEHRGQFLRQTSNAVVPREVSWANLSSMQAHTNQGSCGGCWAVATSNMLAANAEINGWRHSFSAQELVSCVQNTHHCGGTGGCSGATVELAMDWVMDRGLATEQNTPYLGQDTTCRKQTTSLLAHTSDNSLNDAIAVGYHNGPSHSPAFSFGLLGWERLPENRYLPLLHAVAERGPVAVSVGASSWTFYGSGIYDGCRQDAVVNHAVTLIGYGADSQGTNYWLIKNSWGRLWGEQGNIRLLRHVGDNAYCGVDHQPSVGTGCDGGPSTVPVCGMCGILYDSVVPHFRRNSKQSR